MSIDNGGPAFPTETQITENQSTGEVTVHQYLSDGMSLRDYFAAKALVGQLSCQSEESGFYVDFDKLSDNCYQIADAMLKARNK